MKGRARPRSDETLAKAICRLLAEGRDIAIVTAGRHEAAARAFRLAEEKGWLADGKLTEAGRHMSLHSRAGAHRKRLAFL